MRQQHAARQKKGENVEYPCRFFEVRVENDGENKRAYQDAEDAQREKPMRQFPRGIFDALEASGQIFSYFRDEGSRQSAYH